MNKTGTMDSGTRMIVRHARQDDLGELCSILNEIIEIGGTTAFEVRLSEAEFRSHFLDSKHFICCFLAEKMGLILGFQSLSRHPELSEDWADIATFSRASPRVRGVGTTLFESTLALAKRKKIRWINATIRADNKPGLAYYTKMGFSDYSISKNLPLRDGTLVDRISKKLAVTVQ